MSFKIKTITVIGIITATLILSTIIAGAGIPQQISVQGVLRDNSGALLNGTYDLTFLIYNNSTGGTALWNETHTNTAVEDGLFDVTLGSINTLDLPFNEPYYLETKVGEENLTPRLNLTSSPYAFRAEAADVNASQITSGDLPAARMALNVVEAIGTKALDVAAYVNALLLNGSRVMTGDLDMGGGNITNVSTVDGVNVSTELLRRDGSLPMSGDLDMGGNNITNASINASQITSGDLPAARMALNVVEAIGTKALDVAAYVNALLLNGSRAMTGDLDMGGGNITNVSTVDGVNVSARFDTSENLSELLPLDGGRPMTGTLNLCDNKILNVSTPVNSTDAATRGYVDTNFFSNPATSDLDMGGGNITNVSTVDGVNVSARFDTSENLSELLPLDGGRPMTGDLDLGGSDINMTAGIIRGIGDTTYGHAFAAADLTLNRDSTSGTALIFQHQDSTDFKISAHHSANSYTIIYTDNGAGSIAERIRIGEGVSTGSGYTVISDLLGLQKTASPLSCSATYEGYVYYDTDHNVPCFCDCSNWVMFNNTSLTC